MKKKELTDRQKRILKLKDLISACLDRYEEEEVIEAFTEVTFKEYIEKPDELTDGDKIWDLTAKGYCIFKPNSLRESERLRDLAEKYVFPYYNEQLAAILF